MQSGVLSSLAFFAAAYVVISFQFRHTNKRSHTAWVFALAIVAALFAVKLGYDMHSLPVSHYKILEVGRQCTALDIRRSYKRLSKIYHPDKNVDGAEEYFQTVKESYDILMDEEHRDIYNRFGGESLEFDPRKDELKLISDIGVEYLFWAVTGYVMTIPAGARASRTWLMILGVVILAVEVSFKLTETALPAWAPEGLTEHELVFYLHSAFPLLVAALRILAEALYVDADQTSYLVLKELYMHQKGMNELLQQLQSLVEIGNSGGGEQDTSQASAEKDEQQLSSVQGKIAELRDQLDHSNEATAQYIEALRQCSANPGSNYYWLVFVVLYGSIYFMQ